MFKIKHIPIEENTILYVLSKLASTRSLSINHLFIHETLKKPNIEIPKMGMMAINKNERTSYTTPIVRYIEQGILPSNPLEVNLVTTRSISYSLIEIMLYKREFSTPLLKCLKREELIHILDMVHEGIVGNHLGAQALEKKVLRVGYYWSTMVEDVKEYIRKCDICRDMEMCLTHHLQSDTH